MTRYLLPLLFLPLLAIADDEPIPYACDDGSHVEIAYNQQSAQATLYDADKTIVLPQAPAASGVLYHSGGLDVHTKGDDATIVDGKGKPRICRRGTQPPATSLPEPAANGSFINIAGSVTYRARIALPPDATLIIRIQDAAHLDRRTRTLVEQRYDLRGAQVPIPFNATVDHDLFGENTRIIVSARIEAGGRRRFVGAQSYVPPKDGRPVPLRILLKPSSRGGPR